jgi:hypothetical protein
VSDTQTRLGHLAAFALSATVQASEEIDRLQARCAALEASLGGLVQIIDAADLYNLSRGVELGPTVWYVKASDSMSTAKALLEAPKP